MSFFQEFDLVMDLLYSLSSNFALSNQRRKWGLDLKLDWFGKEAADVEPFSHVNQCSLICIAVLDYVYRQVSNIRRTLIGNTIVDHSDVVGASPVGDAPTTSSFST